MANNIIEQISQDDLQLDIKMALQAITRKSPRYTTLMNYYKGFQPLRYSAERLRKAFDQINVYFSQNWVAVIIDAVTDRLVLKGIDISDSVEGQTKFSEIWDEYNLGIIAEDVHESCELLGEGYIIAMNSDDAETPYDIYFNDARMVHMFYDYDQPNKKRYAAKLFIGDDRKIKLTLYYLDTFYYFTSNTKVTNNADWVANANSFLPDDPPSEPNPYNDIPVFHFRGNGAIRKNDVGPSEISMQDAINKLLTDMMVSAEFNTFVQRVVISQSDPGELQNSPNINYWLPAGDSKGQATSIIELGGRALTPFLDAIDKLATSLGIISRTPKHYFFAQGGNSPSGEALIAMEAPLNKKTKKKQARVSVTWKELTNFLLDLEGVSVTKKQIQPVWEPVETVQPKTTADIIKTETDAGIPLKTAVRRQGWSTSEIKQLEDDQKEEKKNMTGLAQSALDQLRAQDQQNNNIGNMPMNNQNQQANNQQQQNNNMLNGNNGGMNNGKPSQ